MSIYLQLLGSAMIPVALSVFFYFLLKKTGFQKIGKWPVQIIIGIFFGAAAVFGTEYGVDVGGATANARDAAPLCAGLLFGAPAGIIAGVIGGVERWLCVYWGGSAYSQIACSVSTLLAGLYAAALRKWMFDDKRPTAGFGAAIAIVMEVIHLSILFLTHLADAEQSYEIVKICTLPMIVCNMAAVLLSILLLSLFSHSKQAKHTREKTISQKVQTAMLICVVMAYLATTLFVYALQTNTAYEDTRSVLSLTLKDVTTDVRNTSDANLMTVTRRIGAAISSNPNVSFVTLETLYNVSEINIVDENGIITKSSNPSFVGFDMASGEQSAEFLVLNEGQDEYVQSLQKASYEENGVAIQRKYAGYALKSGGFVQIGYDAASFQSNMKSYISTMSLNRHVGDSGFVMIANNSKQVLCNPTDHAAATITDAGIHISSDTPRSELLTATIFGQPCFWEYTMIENYYIVAVLPQAEALANRDASVYVNSFMEVIVFALLFALIYFLIKKLVVNNIRSVNKNLKEIIGGNLSVTVDVRSSSEFSSLSDDINSTVTTLKHYISEAAARIDKELEFAKNIQLSSLPSKFPAFPNQKEFDLYATMNTAKEVGGDFYDFYMLDKTKVAILIADVSGKGIPAAMFMMQAKTMIKNFAEENHPVNEIFTRANEKLCETNDAGMFVTAWMAIIDIQTGHVTFANAGHNPPLICRKGAGFEYLRSRAGLVLAGMDGLSYKLQEFDLAPGDRIYLYTDGVTEATDSSNQLYGEDRLQSFLNAHSDLSVNQMLPAVQSDIDAFVGEAEQFDDITMLIFDFFGKEATMDLIEKVFPAKTEALDAVNDFVQAELEKADCGMKTSMQIAVALEELFVNVAHYAYDEGVDGTVTIRAGVCDGLCVIELEDSGKPFDPLQKADPDITLSAEERSIGGLGIFMVKKTMDDVKYRYENGKNILTVYKKI